MDFAALVEESQLALNKLRQELTKETQEKQAHARALQQLKEDRRREADVHSRTLVRLREELAKAKQDLADALQTIFLVRVCCTWTIEYSLS